MSRLSHITYHDDIEQGSEAWLQGREGTFSGSIAYKLLSSFGAGTHALNTLTHWAGNEHTKRGHILEDEALEIYEAINGITVSRTGYVTNTKYPNCIYSPDAFVPDRNVEVKAFAPLNHLKLIKDPYKKMDAIAQAHFGQLITEKKLTDLIAYCPKPKNWDDKRDGMWLVPLDKMFVVIPIEHNPDIQAKFKRVLKEYYDNRGR